ncbi:MAG: mechanosensitive ion channel family protein [Phycisphaerae bacterium]
MPAVIDWQMINNWISEYIPLIAGALVLLVIGAIISAWFGRRISGLLQRSKVEKTLARFLGRISSWGMFLLAILACLSIFDVQTTSFAAIIGGSALAVGLAFQGSLSNLAAGIMLMIFRPYKIDDLVELADETGKVAELRLFFTLVDTFDNRRLMIPNSEIFGSVIENWTFHDKRRVDVPVGVEYPADLDKTRQVLTDCTKNIPGILEDPAPAILLIELGDSSINWQVRVWAPADEYLAVRDATVRAVKQALDAADLGIPFPQMDVHLFKQGEDQTS